jgi:hypothetical protein
MGEREMSRNAFNDCEREYNRREEAIEMAKDQRSEAERIADSRSKSSTQSSDHPTPAEAYTREYLRGYNAAIEAAMVKCEIFMQAGYHEYWRAAAESCRDEVRALLEELK